MPGSLSLQSQCWQVSAPNLLPLTIIFFPFTEKLPMEGWRQWEKQGPLHNRTPFPHAIGFPSSHLDFSFQQGRTFLAGQTRRESSLARGKKCDPYRRAVLKRTPPCCKALCNNSKDCFLSEDVLLSGMSDDRSFLPNQTKNPEMHLGRSVPQTAWLPLRLSPAFLLQCPKKPRGSQSGLGHLWTQL